MALCKDCGWWNRNIHIHTIGRCKKHSSRGYPSDTVSDQDACAEFRSREYQSNGWVNADDKLPPMSRPVLVFGENDTGNRVYTIAFLNKELNWFLMNGVGKMNLVDIYWRYLPAPPDGDNVITHIEWYNKDGEA